MRQLIVFCALIAVSVADWEPGLRVKFNVGLSPGTDFFFDVPKTVGEALNQEWTLTQRSSSPNYRTLNLYCPTERVLCAYFDNTGTVAGLQIALPQDEVTDDIYDWETLGFNEWVPAVSAGEIIKYWAIQQYFISEESLTNSTSAGIVQRDNAEILREDAVWLTGFNRQIDRVSRSRTDIENSVYTLQACIPWMGRHFYYNMTKEMECSASTLYPWFPLVHSGELIGFGFMVFAKHPIKANQRDWFERPSRSAVEAIVPEGPQCLYELADSPGIVTMHIYYVDKPWNIFCFFQ